MFDFLKDIFNDGPPRRTRKGRPARPRDLHTFTVQKPYCAPARDFVYTALEPYGIPVTNFSEKTTGISIKDYAKLWKIELRTFENLKYGPAAVDWLPLAIQATFSVPKAQAGWAEYLIESTGRLAVTGGRVNAKNREWGNRRLGKMPPPSNRAEGQAYARAEAKRLEPPPEGKPWVESSCNKGKALWKEVGTRVKKAKHR